MYQGTRIPLKDRQKRDNKYITIFHEKKQYKKIKIKFKKNWQEWKKLESKDLKSMR